MSLIPTNQIFQSQQSKLVKASVKRAVINNVNVGTRTADVYFVENPQTVIRNIPIASGIDVASISVGMQARVDTFDETNPNNMVVSYVMGQAAPKTVAQKRFIDLTDVPQSYVGAAGEFVKVTMTEDGLEFGTGGGGTPGGNDQDIQLNAMGAFSGDDNFKWDYNQKFLRITDIDQVGSESKPTTFQIGHNQQFAGGGATILGRAAQVDFEIGESINMVAGETINSHADAAGGEVYIQSGDWVPDGGNDPIEFLGGGYLWLRGGNYRRDGTEGGATIITSGNSNENGGPMSVIGGDGFADGGTVYVLGGEGGGFVGKFIVNAFFNGDASGWTLGAGWAYNSNNVIHTPGSTAEMGQTFVGGIAIKPYRDYQIRCQIGGTTGTLSIGFKDSAGTNHVVSFPAGFAGTAKAVINNDGGISGTDFFVGVVFVPSSDFDGTLDAVQVFFYSTGNGGPIFITAGDATFETSGNGGSIESTAGEGTEDSTGGHIYEQAGAGGDGGEWGVTTGSSLIPGGKGGDAFISLGARGDATGQNGSFLLTQENSSIYKYTKLDQAFTTDATPANMFNIPINGLIGEQTALLEAHIVARASDGTGAAYVIRETLLCDNTPVYTLHGGQVDYIFESDASWDISFSLSGSGGSTVLHVAVSGAAATNIFWACELIIFI